MGMVEEKEVVWDALLQNAKRPTTIKSVGQRLAAARTSQDVLECLALIQHLESQDPLGGDGDALNKGGS